MSGFIKFFRVLITVLLSIIFVIYLIPYGLFCSVKLYTSPNHMANTVDKCIDCVLEDTIAGKENAATSSLLSSFENLGFTPTEVKSFFEEEDVQEFLEDTIEDIVYALNHQDQAAELPEFDEFSELIYVHQDIVLQAFDLPEGETVDRETCDEISSELYEMLTSGIQSLLGTKGGRKGLVSGSAGTGLYGFLNKINPMNANSFPDDGSTIAMIFFCLNYRPLMLAVNGLALAFLLLIVLVNCKKYRFLTPIAVCTIIPSVVFIVAMIVARNYVGSLLTSYGSLGKALLNGYYWTLAIVLAVYLLIAIACIVIKSVLKKKQAVKTKEQPNEQAEVQPQ